LSFAKRVCVSRDSLTAINLVLDQGRIFQEPDDLIPYKFIQIILPDRTIRKHGPRSRQDNEET